MRFFKSFSALKFINIKGTPNHVGYFLADGNLCATVDFCESGVTLAENVHSYYCIDESIIFAIMVDSTGINNFIKSTDGGLTWKKNQIDFWGTKIHFSTTDIGFILGDNTIVGSFFYKSSDGGDNWDINIQKYSYPFKDVVFINNKRGFAVGGYNAVGGFHAVNRYGDMFYTEDSGKTWDHLFEGENWLTSCFFTNDQVGYSIINRIWWRTGWW